MKRIFLLSVLIAFALTSYAQRTALTPRINIEGKLISELGDNPAGTPIQLIQVTNHNGEVNLIISIGNTSALVPCGKAYKTLELSPTSMEEFWLCEYIRYNMYGHYAKKGYRLSLRQEITREASDYQDNLSNLFYREDYVQDYVRSIFNGIAPRNLNNSRPERLDVEILQSPNPDAYMLPNGTLLISTGLLSTLDSVEELSAIIVSEMAHFILDHQLINTAKEAARVRRAEFWGSMLVAAATGVEIALTENNDHYFPGGIMLTAGVIDIALNSSALNRLGMGYTDKQVEEADKLAINFLQFNKMNPNALASALIKIKTYYEIENDSYALSKKGAYGNVRDRLSRLDAPEHIENRAFQKTMSGVSTLNATILQNSKNFAGAEHLAGRNIERKLASDDDYLIFIKANMNQANSPEANEKNLELVRKAKEQSLVPNLGIYKQEILLLLRLNKQTKATESLREYVGLLTEFKQHATHNNDIEWASAEIGWANKLYQQTSLF